MAALAIPARLPGALRRRDTLDSLKTLVPGRRFLAFYGGADNVWHEQVAGWPASADGGTWAICTSDDGDVYNQDMVGGTMATHVVVLPPDGTRPGGLAAGIYSFTRGLTAAEMLGAIRRCRVEAITNVASESVLPVPAHVLMWGGRSMTLAEAGLAVLPCHPAVVWVQRFLQRTQRGLPGLPPGLPPRGLCCLSCREACLPATHCRARETGWPQRPSPPVSGSSAIRPQACRLVTRSFLERSFGCSGLTRPWLKSRWVQPTARGCLSTCGRRRRQSPGGHSHAHG